jgi:hypothetical protein
MRFGTAKKNISDAPKDSDWLRNFKAGETKIRFIDECDEWIVYREHFMEGKSFPCTQDRNSCPGCTSENEQESRASRKYATNVLMPETGYVVPIKMPVTLVNRLVSRSERNGGTITNRDYTVIKDGKGLETTYDVEQDDKYEVDIVALKRQAKDIESILSQTYVDAWGELPEVRSKPKVKTETKPVAVAVEEEEIPFDKASAKEAGAEEISEESVRRMSKEELIDLADRAGVKITAYMRSEIVEQLLEALAED